MESGVRVKDYITNYTGNGTVQEVTECTIVFKRFTSLCLNPHFTVYMAKFKGYQVRHLPSEVVFGSACYRRGCHPSSAVFFVILLQRQYVWPIRSLFYSTSRSCRIHKQWDFFWLRVRTCSFGFGHSNLYSSSGIYYYSTPKGDSSIGLIKNIMVVNIVYNVT